MIAQAVLLALIVFLPARDDWPVAAPLARLGDAAALAGLVGVGLGAVNLGRSLTALPLPRRDGELRTDGLYRLVRHPIYAGLHVFAASRASTSGSLVRAAVFVALAALLWHKAGWEERRLARRFPEYPEYAARTPPLLPRLNRFRGRVHR